MSFTSPSSSALSEADIYRATMKKLELTIIDDAHLHRVISDFHAHLHADEWNELDCIRLPRRQAIKLIQIVNQRIETLYPVLVKILHGSDVHAELADKLKTTEELIRCRDTSFQGHGDSVHSLHQQMSCAFAADPLEESAKAQAVSAFNVEMTSQINPDDIITSAVFLTDAERHEIEQTRGPSEKMHKFVRIIERNPSCFDTFCELLEDNGYAQLAGQLMSKEQAISRELHRSSSASLQTEETAAMSSLQSESVEQQFRRESGEGRVSESYVSRSRSVKQATTTVSRQSHVLAAAGTDGCSSAVLPGIATLPSGDASSGQSDGTMFFLEGSDRHESARSFIHVQQRELWHPSDYAMPSEATTPAPDSSDDSEVKGDSGESSSAGEGSDLDSTDATTAVVYEKYIDPSSWRHSGLHIPDALPPDTYSPEEPPPDGAIDAESSTSPHHSQSDLVESPPPTSRIRSNSESESNESNSAGKTATMSGETESEENKDNSASDVHPDKAHLQLPTVTKEDILRRDARPPSPTAAAKDGNHSEKESLRSYSSSVLASFPSSELIIPKDYDDEKPRKSKKRKPFLPGLCFKPADMEDALVAGLVAPSRVEVFPFHGDGWSKLKTKKAREDLCPQTSSSIFISLHGHLILCCTTTNRFFTRIAVNSKMRWREVRTTGDTITPRQWVTAAPTGNTVYLVGGTTCSVKPPSTQQAPVSTVQSVVVVERKLCVKNCAPLPYAVDRPAVTFCDNELVVIGGKLADGSKARFVQRMDAQGNWHVHDDVLDGGQQCLSGCVYYGTTFLCTRKGVFRMHRDARLPNGYRLKGIGGSPGESDSMIGHDGKLFIAQGLDTWQFNFSTKTVSLISDLPLNTKKVKECRTFLVVAEV